MVCEIIGMMISKTIGMMIFKTIGMIISETIGVMVLEQLPMMYFPEKSNITSYEHKTNYNCEIYGVSLKSFHGIHNRCVYINIISICVF